MPTASIQCVREDDIAWHARGGNASSIGIELAGYAGQRALGWNDDYSRAVVERAARLTAEVCERYGIPMRRLRAADLVAGRRGVTGHADVSAAFRKSDHWDPGPGLPLDAVPAPSAQQRRRRARHARPEATSSSSARVITSGGEICKPPPTSVRVSTPWSRASSVDAIGQRRVVGEQRRVDLDRGDGAEARADLA